MFRKIPKGNKVYKTTSGLQVVGDSKEILKKLPEGSVDLVITSPPFALLRQKSYGNESQDKYVDWLTEFAFEIKRVLKETGSFVLDLGGAYQKGKPVRSLYNYKVLVKFVEEVGFHLAEEFFWYNPAKLPSPIEWVNKRKIRAKDAVNTVWWFSKTEFPNADVKKVLVPYSDRMKKLIKNPSKFYKPKGRPSGHEISSNFGKDNGGAIPSNLLTISNSNSNCHYLSSCKKLEHKSHPARFPAELPKFFIKFLTEPKDVVVDIFSGSNTTGKVCEELDRRWLSIDLSLDYASLSSIRFMENYSAEEMKDYIQRMNRPEFIDFTKVKKK